MGFLKKVRSQPAARSSKTATAPGTPNSAGAAMPMRKNRSFFGRKLQAQKQPPTPPTTAATAASTNVSPADQEREIIRKQLFSSDPAPPEALSRIATSQSVEVTTSGQLLAATPRHNHSPRTTIDDPPPATSKVPIYYRGLHVSVDVPSPPSFDLYSTDSTPLRRTPTRPSAPKRRPSDPYDQALEYAVDEMKLLETMPIGDSGEERPPPTEDAACDDKVFHVRIPGGHDQPPPPPQKQQQQQQQENQRESQQVCQQEPPDDNSSNHNHAVVERMSELSTLGQSFDTDAMMKSEVTSNVSSNHPAQPPPTLTDKVLNALQCGNTTTPSGTSFQQTVSQVPAVRNVVGLFYENEHLAKLVKHVPLGGGQQQQPEESGMVPTHAFYDEAFTHRFTRRMTSKGAALLYLQAPGTPGNRTDEWKGRTIAMILLKGNSHEQEAAQPRLEWTTVAGGQTMEVATTTVPLFDILSVTATTEDLSLAEEEDTEGSTSPIDMCLFTITTNHGDIYVFESNSPEERDSIVHGLKNVISRLARHLITGDLAATSELYEDATTDENVANPAMSGSLPALLSPKQTMNRVAHLMLD